MEGIGSEVSQKVKSAIKAKLVELGVYVDEELPDYIMVMVANKRSKSEMIEDLQLFLGVHTEKFISWLLQVLQKLHEVTVKLHEVSVASLDAKRAFKPGEKEKEKVGKKKKQTSGESELESSKKDRKRKVDSSKKDSFGKKTKKALKNKSAKSDIGKIMEKRIAEKIDVPIRDKKEIYDKSKEQLSTCIVKSIPRNLPSTSRSNAKPVLMVSDEDDEDFINIRADAEADDLVGEFQEDIKPVQLQRNTAESLVTKSLSVLQRIGDKTVESVSHVVSFQEGPREPESSTQKNIKPHLVDAGSSCVQKSAVINVIASSVKPISVKRTPAIQSPEPDTHYSRNSTEREEKEDENKTYDLPRPQPSSKITAVYNAGNVKSRLGRKPMSKEDSPPRTKGRGVTSIVKVKGRPKIPLSAQANKNLILKAVAEAQKSVASSLIRTEPILKSQGLLTKKNRTDFSKIAVTLPNPRVTSTSQPVRRTLENGSESNRLNYQPTLLRSMADTVEPQSRSRLPLCNLPMFREVLSMSHLGLEDPTSLPSVCDHSEAQELIRASPYHNYTSTSDLSMNNVLQSVRDIPPFRDISPARNFPPIRDLQTENLPSVRDFSSVPDLSEIRNLAPNHDLQEPSISLSQPIQSRSCSFPSQSQAVCPHTQLIQNPLQQPHSRSQLVQTQPQPDIVASLREGQSVICQTVGNTVERMTMTENVSSSNDVPLPSLAMDHLDSEMECQCPSQEATREMDPTSLPGRSYICTAVEEESTEMQEKPISPVPELPTPPRPCSPQFFVTLNGYDPNIVNGVGRIVRSGLSEKSRNIVVAEDDMDVEQDYMDEGIGEEQDENVEDTDMLEEDLEKNNPSSRPVIFRKITPENSGNDADVQIKVNKNTERCRFWPACRLGERCDFHHPTIPCKSFPACKFGDKCLYIHPNCKFDAACTRKDCPFTHAIPRSLVIAPIAAPVRVPVRPMSIQCRFFPKCTNVNCKFYHPKFPTESSDLHNQGHQLQPLSKPCRFGKACNKYDCPYMHEREQLPSKDKLKWVCPGKA